MKLQLSLRNIKQVNNESAAANDSKNVIKQRMSIMTNEHRHMLAYWFLSYIGRKGSSSSSAVNSRISRGGSLLSHSNGVYNSYSALSVR